jgi:DNA primase large subunit
MEYSLEELKTLARYPFMEEAKKYVQQLGLSIEEIAEHPVYSSAIELGKQRILEVLENRFKPEADDKTALEILIQSYPVARIYISFIGNRILASRYANAEANLAYEYLRKESKKTIERIRHDLNLPAGESMPVADYLHLASKLAKEDAVWKLANRTLNEGMVYLHPGEDITVIREAIRLKVAEPVKLKKIPDGMKKQLDELKGTFTTALEEPTVEFVDKKAMPPCMIHITALLQNNQANHTARFILATFLSGIGLAEEEILKIFAASPKFDEDKTRYQLEFLTGQKGNTKYTCPACVTIKSYGLCKADCPVKHPQQYYRRLGNKEA